MKVFDHTTFPEDIRIGWEKYIEYGKDLSKDGCYLTFYTDQGFVTGIPEFDEICNKISKLLIKNGAELGELVLISYYK